MPPSIAAFHGQQAIEKLLKAWVFATGVEPPRTHNLGELTSLLELNGCSIPLLAVPLAVFSDFAVQWRYEAPPQTSTPDIAAMQEAVRELHRVVVPQITTLLSALTP